MNSSADLLERARRRERQAFDELTDKFRERLETYVHFRSGERLRQDADLEDILQETFIRALASIEQFKGTSEASFFRWLKTIAEHAITDLARREALRSAAPLDGDVAAAGVSPSKAGRRSERFDRLEKALNALSPEHREVIVLARLEGLSIQEVARQMGRSPDAVTHLLIRAVRKLRATFGDTESLHLPHRAFHLRPGPGDRTTSGGQSDGG